MNFSIQVGNPKVFIVDKIVVADDLSEAIEEIFPMETEAVIVNWNNTLIPLSYKYDLSVLIEDLLQMLLFVCTNDEGTHFVRFGSNSFNTEWEVRWNLTSLSISANWHEVNADLEVILRNCSILKIPKQSFLKEWNGVIHCLEKAIYESKIVILDMTELKILAHLKSLIKGYGELYSNQTEENKNSFGYLQLWNDSKTS